MKKGIKTTTIGALALGLFIGAPLGVFYGIPTEPYGEPNNIVAEEQELEIGTNPFLSEPYNTDQYNSDPNVKFEETEDYEEYFEFLEITQTPTNEQGTVVEVKIEFRFNENNDKGGTNDNDYQVVLYEYDLYGDSPYDMIEVGSPFFNEHSDNLSSHGYYQNKIQAEKNESGNFEITFTTSETTLYKVDIVNITQGEYLYYNQVSEREEVLSIPITFQTHVYRMAPALKTTVYPAEGKNSSNDLRPEIDKATREMYPDFNGDEEKLNEILEDLGTYPEKGVGSGWYNYIIDFREPYGNGNHHMGNGEPENEQGTNINNGVEDLTTDYEISLVIEAGVMGSFYNYNEVASDGNGFARYNPLLAQGYDEELTYNFYGQEFTFYAGDSGIWDLTTVAYEFNGVFSTNEEYNYYNLLTPNENYIFDELLPYTNFEAVPYLEYDEETGYFGIKIDNVTYLPETGGYFGSDTENIYSTYLVVENDLNKDGEYTPIDGLDKGEDFYTPIEIEGVEDKSSADGETKIFSVSFGTTDLVNPTIHGGFEMPSDPGYDKYIYGHENTNYYYDFEYMPPIAITGLILITILTGLVVYYGATLALNKDKRLNGYNHIKDPKSLFIG